MLGRVKPPEARLVVVGDGWPEAERKIKNHIAEVARPWKDSPVFRAYAASVGTLESIEQCIAQSDALGASSDT